MARFIAYNRYRKNNVGFRIIKEKLFVDGKADWKDLSVVL